MCLNDTLWWLCSVSFIKKCQFLYHKMVKIYFSKKCFQRLRRLDQKDWKWLYSGIEKTKGSFI